MRPEKYILDERGEPMVEPDLMKWAIWFEQETRIVKQEWVDNVWVSTVFLGLDHNFSRKGPPVLWETMTFSNRKDFDQNEMDRCSGSREQALAMHERMLVKVKERLLKVKGHEPRDSSGG